MKKLTIIIACMLVSAAVSAQETVADSAAVSPDAAASPAPAAKDYAAPASAGNLWDAANTAYVNASYAQAASLYDSLLKTGAEGYKLYYNLGNAYFKSGRTGKAILYYNKAAKLAPADADVRYNLAVANGYVKDKIEQLPEFFLSRWIRALRTALGPGAWTLISLAMLSCAMAAFLLYMFSGRLRRRKAGFFATMACASLFVISTVFAAVSYRRIVSPDEGVVTVSSVAVKSSPDRSSQDLFVLHEGTKVRVVSALGGWSEVVIADGNKGWLETQSIEMI